MNKKMLWIGVLLLVVLGLIAIGRNMDRPQPEAPTAEVPAPNATAPTDAKPAAKLAPKAPPKAVAAPKNGVAALDAMPESIMLDLSSDFAKEHESDLQRYLRNDPDFDHYYVVAQWQYGSKMYAGVIDKRTGKAYLAPANNIQNKRPGSNFSYYSLDSNLYRIVNDDVIETYSFDGQRFTLLNIENF